MAPLRLCGYRAADLQRRQRVRIAFIGYGEAGRAFRASLADRVAGVSAYDIRDDDEMQAAMARDGVARGEGPADALATADWIVSAVTADQSLEAARAAAEHVRQGQVYFDINSVSPNRKRESARLIEGRAARYVDMAVMAPVHPRGHATATLVAGPAVEDLAEELRELGFSFDVAGPEVGAATAIKMVRSLFVKGLEAITVETLLAAHASGCYDAVLASLSKSFPGLGWPEVADYNFERSLRHGARRAAEMRESAATLDELGFRGALATEIAEVQDRMGAAGREGPAEGDLADVVAEVAARRLRA
jgi:3-hydroxyisobutyrate dehydrogenase-like beta-hydroxyacid dehydrogenase